MPSNRDKQDEQWLAVFEYIRLMEKEWDATVVVRITADGAQFANTAHVSVTASVPVLAGPGRCHKLEEAGTFPGNQHSSVGGLVYFLIHRLDARIGRELHVQQALPF